ncbi:MAG: hypothetical protein ABIE36_03385 [Candidatus Diapherotrites archaeon]
MRKEVIVLVFLLSIMFLLPLVLADELTQVEKAYTCLENKINLSKCSSLQYEERVFSLLATGLCEKEVSADNSLNQCWPKSGCKIKSTAQAVLALNKKIDTTKAENWLLSQISTPKEIDWFLEIESSKATSCTIVYSDTDYTLTIGDNKKISSSNLGACLSLAQNNYWLEISPTCYNKEIYISCDNPSKGIFITTLLFKKNDSETVHVSSTPNSAPANGRTTEKVDALCFSQLPGGACDYEGSLWATLVLYSLGHDVSRFMPYLITIMDGNSKYIPESFLYFLTGKFEIELLLKQKAGLYWAESEDKYYDTAIALWPFRFESPYEKQSSKEWLLRVQEASGCWNGGNIRDTAFILYSIWPRGSPPGPGPECLITDDCISVSCQDRFCNEGVCLYDYFGCGINDGCCPPDCTYLMDGDCDECTSDSDCDIYDSESSNYCSGDKVYKDIVDYSCENKVCVPSEDSQLVTTCNADEICDSGYCLPGGGPEPDCWTYDDCPVKSCEDAFCIGGVCSYDYVGCIDNDDCCHSPGCTYLNDNDCSEGPQCTNDGGCEDFNSESIEYCSEDKTKVYRDKYHCEIDICVKDAIPELINTCDEDEECLSGTCLGTGIIGPCENWWECPPGEDCIDGECVYSTLLDCVESDYFCMSAINCKEEDLLGEDYICSGEGLFVCCDAEEELGVCVADYGGEICDLGEFCPLAGTIKEVKDTTAEQICCVGATCETFAIGCTINSDCLEGEECINSVCLVPSECTINSNCPGGECFGGFCSYENSCANNNGECKSTCGKKEEEKSFYICEGNNICCKETEKKSYLWIVILLILIVLCTIGIVFRDKLRTQWFKLKSKFGKKKEKNKFEMPSTHVGPVGGPLSRRILPRRILPPHSGTPSGSRPMPVRRPLSRGKVSPIKKPEEKPKNELDDVLKKLRDIGK